MTKAAEVETHSFLLLLLLLRFAAQHQSIITSIYNVKTFFFIVDSVDDSRDRAVDVCRFLTQSELNQIN